MACGGLLSSCADDVASGQSPTCAQLSGRSYGPCGHTPTPPPEPSSVWEGERAMEGEGEGRGRKGSRY